MKARTYKWSITTLPITLLVLFALMVMLSQKSWAQTVTGQISGTVTDPSRAVIGGAKVTLTFGLTGQTRDAVTSNSGDFVFTEVPPGSYTLAITATGFQGYRQNGITVTTSERVALHEIPLTIGGVTEQVSVEATAAHVETDSSDHSSLISAQQFLDIPDKGRNFVDYLGLVPGSTVTTQTDSAASNTQRMGFNGAENQTIIQLDGIQSQDIGFVAGTGFLAPNVDAISEVKVLTGAVPAEYGARSNGSIIVSVKSGTRQFHGSLYEYNRNDAYNANTYTNNLVGRARQPYKYNNPGGTIGGPVVIPGLKFNSGHDKLFFFGAVDLLFRNVPTATDPFTFVMPTLAERKGNFSLTPSSVVQGSFCPGGAAPTSLNPLTCSGFPASTAGTNLMALFPNPTCNRTAANGGANDVAANAGLTLPACPSTSNWIGTFTQSQPRKDYIIRTDYQITKNNLLYVRYIQDYTGQDHNQIFLNAAQWGQLISDYDVFSRGGVITLVSSIRPNLVNEFVVGENIAWQNAKASTAAALAKNIRTNVGLGSNVLPTLFPTTQNNPLNLLPNASFGGGKFVGSAAGLSEDNRFPFYSTTRSYNTTDSLAWSLGRHNMKFGVYYENSPRTSVSSITFNGSLNFQVSTTNNLDTGYTYSNAYLGVVQNYSEANIKPLYKVAVKSLQWYAQDNWKVTRRVALDYGVRFYHNPDPNSRNNLAMGYFDPATYSKAAQPTLIPTTATPTSTIGLFAPGTGTPFQGMIVLPGRRLRKDPPLVVAPRFGVAWDVMGDGKTALRAGFGAFSEPLELTLAASSYITQPPSAVTPTVFNTTISALGGASGLLGPTAVLSTPQNYHGPVSYQYNFGIQRDLGHNILLDVAYLGNLGRHRGRNGTNGDQINFVPYGAAAGNASLAGRPNFLRPYIGYAGINLNTFSSSSNFNSLQIQVNKRVGRLAAGGSYTLSKVLDDFSARAIGIGVPLGRYYGPSNDDRRHNLAINFTYKITKPTPTHSWLLNEAVGGWNVQAFANFVSGAPQTLTGSFASDWSLTAGGGGPTALNRLSNPVLAKGMRVTPAAGHLPQYLDITSVGVPAGGPGVCTVGAAPTSCGLGNMPFKAAYYGPGINNWDISMFKNFPLGHTDARNFQLRVESYNTFNHTQYTGVNSSVSILATGAIAPVSAQNTNFGQYSGVQPARILVLAGKVTF